MRTYWRQPSSHYSVCSQVCHRIELTLCPVGHLVHLVSRIPFASPTHKVQELRPHIKGYDSSDVRDLETWKPLDPADVCFSVAMHIGPDDEVGSDIFQVGVATREGLQRVMGEAYRNPEPHMLMIHKRDWQLIEEGSLNLWDSIWERIQAIVDECQGRDWQEIATELSKHFAWEYADCNG
jgi:hypothetical protein